MNDSHGPSCGQPAQWRVSMLRACPACIAAILARLTSRWDGFAPIAVTPLRRPQ